jgi:hypothetical protein
MGNGLRREHELNASRCAGFAFDQSSFFESDYHLVHGWCCDLEMAAHVGLRRRPFEDPAVGVDEGEILALQLGEAPLVGRLLFGKCLVWLICDSCPAIQPDLFRWRRRPGRP